ncbi:MAG: hypothetical protein BGP13_09760 [Sphingobacteriales bacterium 40-81]|mgnify:CR=1 FL=1|nr:MAG: hypothetical protein BGP13_09760 [Sphingobacteriales bacterium 40-81]
MVLERKTSQRFIFMILWLSPLWLGVGISAQPGHAIRQVNIGGQLPEVGISLLNDAKKNVSLSSFNNKYLILDFWATWCTSCYKTFPKMDSLQQEFGNNLQVLLVNAKGTLDDEKKITSFFQKRKRPDGKPFNLPTIINDTILDKLFPHKLIPHYVWIDDKGIVQAITSTEQLTRENVNAFVSGSKLFLPSKRDLDVQLSKPLFINGNGGENENYIYRSFLTGKIDGLPSAYGGTTTSDENALLSRIFITNSTRLAIYTQAWPEIRQYPRNRLIIINDIARGASISKAAEKYSYELLFPERPLKAARKLMQEDLYRYFGVTVNTEKRVVSCLVMVCDSSQNTNKRIPPITKKLKQQVSDDSFLFQDAEQLVSYLNSISEIPVVNDACAFEKLAITIPNNREMTLSTISELLETHGFHLRPAVRHLDFMIIKESSSSE